VDYDLASCCTVCLSVSFGLVCPAALCVSWFSTVDATSNAMCSVDYDLVLHSRFVTRPECSLTDSCVFS
jgi:hypothetical protein